MTARPAASLPPILLQPWEGFSAKDILRLAGGRPPVLLPAWLCRGVVAVGRGFCIMVPSSMGAIHRVELMWFGQRQLSSPSFAPELLDQESLRAILQGEGSESASLECSTSGFTPKRGAALPGVYTRKFVGRAMTSVCSHDPRTILTAAFTLGAGSDYVRASRSTVHPGRSLESATPRPAVLRVRTGRRPKFGQSIRPGILGP